jgi:hypothetical protein
MDRYPSTPCARCRSPTPGRSSPTSRSTAPSG